MTHSQSNWQLTETIANLPNQRFDIVGDRLYAIFPGTNDQRDKAALLSIVDLSTLQILDAGGERGGGISGYPDTIEVFNNIAVVGATMGGQAWIKFFDVSEDKVHICY